MGDIAQITERNDIQVNHLKQNTLSFDQTPTNQPIQNQDQLINISATRGNNSSLLNTSNNSKGIRNIQAGRFQDKYGDIFNLVTNSDNFERKSKQSLVKGMLSQFD